MNKKFKVEEKVTTEVKVTVTDGFKMSLGNIVTAENNDVPQLEVYGLDRNDQPKTYYVSPFRAYGFQVSHTIDGRMSAGCSFINLKEIVRNNTRDTAILIMRTMIADALHEHDKGYDGKWIASFQEELQINHFAELAYKWVYFIVKDENNHVEQQMKKSAEQWQNYHNQQQCTTEKFIQDCEDVKDVLKQQKEEHELKQKQKRSNKKNTNVTIIERLKNMVVKQA